VEDQRQRADEDQLGRRILRPEFGDGKIRQDQRHHRQSCEDAQCGGRAFSTMMTAEKTVSRATDEAPGGAETMIETISAASITVTATASRMEPKGSPT